MSATANRKPGLRRTAVFALAILAVAIVMALAGTLFFRFVNQNVHDESQSHLTEVFSQVNDKFSSLVSGNWKRLDTWGYHIASLPAGTDDEVHQFVNMVREQWGFTNFYFMDRNGAYLTEDGATGYFDLGDQLEILMVNGLNVVVDGTLPTGSGLTLFAVPAPEGLSYRGFEYAAIAVSYNNVDMEAALDVAAFDGQADCYVTYPDGRILFSATLREEQPYNYLTYVEDDSDLSEAEFAALKSDFEQGLSNMVQYEASGTDWYLTYQPVGFQDWMLVGAVPKDVANAAMNRILRATVMLFSGLFVITGVAVVVSLRLRGKRILDAKQAEIEHRESLFTTMTENTEDIFVLFTADDYAVEYVSPNVERILGIHPDAVQQSLRAMDNHDSEEDYRPTRAQLDQVERGLCWQGEHERVHLKTGERRWYQESLYRETAGGQERFILVLTDRTQERENEQILKQALDIAGRANEAKSAFLANMSHDIRTPLNGAMGMTDVVLRRLDPDEQSAKDLRDAKASMNHLLGLINDILDMSKIESGRMTLHEQACNLDLMLEEVAGIIRPQADAKRQEFTIDSSATKRRTFTGDPMRIKQILLNLLSNAIKYTPEGGCISLTVEEHEQVSPTFARMRFTVKDNGIGMPAHFLDRIFDPFERGDQPGVDGIQGTGLGMPISKSLAEAMGGTISVESEVDKGSTFTLALDLKVGEDAEAVEGPGTVAQTEHYEYAGKRFLLAEDNEINALVFMGLVGEEGLGAAIDWAENGKQALEMFEAKPVGFYDVVFMDVMMPMMDGYAATAAIRALPRKDAASVRIVALTANAFAEDVQAALDAGMDAHVSKPIVLDDLEQTLLKLG